MATLRPSAIGSYNGLRLLVRSEYRLDGSFDRNIFFVEGKSGLKYKCGMSGSLPPSFAAAATFPQATLENIPKLMERQAERQKHLEEEIPTLQQIKPRWRYYRSNLCWYSEYHWYIPGKGLPIIAKYKRCIYGC